MPAVTIDSENFRTALHAMQADLAVNVERVVAVATHLAGAAAVASPLFKDRTGKTRRSVRAEASGTRGVLRAAGAARFLQSGTRPHLIVANRRRTLRFVANGTTFFRPVVHHPGTHPRPFLDVAVLEASRYLDAALPRLIDEAARRYGLA